jgi:hypothetical protein
MSAPALAAPVQAGRLVPQICAGGTAVCLAPGPSLTAEDVAHVRGKATVIAISGAIRLAPWANVFYSGARDWWTPQVLATHLHGFQGIRARLCLDRDLPGLTADGVALFLNGGDTGLDLRPNALRTYKNSGGAAINLAVHLGATRILLLGYDMRPVGGRHHFYDPKPVPHGSPYLSFRKLMATMVTPLAAAGVTVVNCSRQTALECFPRAALREVLP